jgi:hypothetical protein
MANCYNNGIIYKLCCRDTAIKDIYVGSTCSFRQRKSQHKHSCNTENGRTYNYPVYQFIRDHGGFSNWEMIEIKKVNCETKRELDKEERAVLEMLGGTLNSRVPSRKLKEWAEIHKDEVNNYGIEYRKTHKEQIRKVDKAYYEKNKDVINEKARTEMIKCECGSTIRKRGKTKHLKTTKHQKQLKSIC